MFLPTGNQAILSFVTSWTHVAIRCNMWFFSVQRCFLTLKHDQTCLYKGTFCENWFFFCKMVQFLVCYPCAATREINCFCCTQPRGKRMNMMQIRLNHRHGKNAHHFCEGCFFFISPRHFSASNQILQQCTNLGKWPKVASNVTAVFLANFWRSTWAKLLYSMSKLAN